MGCLVLLDLTQGGSMSYQVIARKWRPQTFEQVIGQNHVSQTLTKALKAQRLPHALLFTGPRGTGKTSSARILAKSLCCTNLQGVAPCNTCKSCLGINEGSSLNVMEIDGASHNGVESIRELIETIGYMPPTGKHKIYIIDEVHMLSTSAFNALLKTLEEPPSYVTFVMATTEVHKIPYTILSRCQRFDFHRIPTSIIVKKLDQICQDEQVSAQKEALWMLAKQADGSLRDSQSLLDQIIVFSDFEITQQKVVEVLGLTDRQIILDSLQALVQHSTACMLETIKRMAASALEPKVFIQELLEEIRHLLVVKLSPEKCSEIVDLADSEIEQLKVFANQLTIQDIHLLFDMGLQGANDIPRSIDPWLVLEILMLRMATARITPERAFFKEKKPVSSVLPPDTPQAKRKEAFSQKPSITPERVPFKEKKPVSSVLPMDPPPANKKEACSQKPSSTPERASFKEKKPASSDLPPDPPPANKKEACSQKPSSTPERASFKEKKPASSDLPPDPPPANKKEAFSQKPLKTPTPFTKVQWMDLVKRIKEVNPIMGAKLENTYIILEDEKSMVVGIPEKMSFLYNGMKTEEFQKELQGHISKFHGSSPSIRIVSERDAKMKDTSSLQTLREVEATEEKQKATALYQQASHHPAIQSMQSLFKTKQISVETKNHTKETP